MKLFTKEILNKLEKITPSNWEKEIWDMVVGCKIFNPMGWETWYITQIDEEEKGIVYGYASLTNDECNEFGSISIEELESIKLPFWMTLERDLYSKMGTVKEMCESDWVQFNY